MSQRTIAEKISCTGIGLHTGAPVQLTLHPARVGSGIVFVRSDLAHPVEIPARRDSVTSTVMATTLGRGDATVSTVEHLLSALYSLGVDNARIEVDGPEIPVMDGSAASFVFLIRSAGLFDQNAPRRLLRIRETLEVRDGDRAIRIEAARSLRVTYSVDFAHPAIGRQSLSDVEVNGDTFEREIGRARTFGFLREVETLWRNGLGRGGNLDNTVIMDDHRVLNDDGLRWSDEFVRHKILDLIGDISLLGVPLAGHITAVRGGHALHQALVEKILANPHAWVLEGGDADTAALEHLPVGAPAQASA
ncbi:MAG: UDP-3-O-acyl-N-acetylglucosamine deacetylase [Deltaproteobacteria bacterium]|nr:UDP-3-O-acyl-N-acetylglucosamine deacetylase [Deltaproteobacteria bacterium]MBW2395115.1 UDP-3-O-acyl-N-acetylglucosamine deacetylase [Deltaproteobacteria bacterium]